MCNLSPLQSLLILGSFPLCWVLCPLSLSLSLYFFFSLSLPLSVCLLSAPLPRVESGRSPSTASGLHRSTEDIHGRYSGSLGRLRESSSLSLFTSFYLSSFCLSSCLPTFPLVSQPHCLMANSHWWRLTHVDGRVQSTVLIS